MAAPTKRASSVDEAAPPPGKRLRVTIAAPDGGSSNPEPSPRKRFLAVVLVVLFFKRPKCRSTDTVPVSLWRIGRLETELGRLREGLGQVRDTLRTLLREQECIKKLIRVLSSKLDNIIGPPPSHQNHELPTHGKIQEGANAEAQGSARTETEGKEDARIRLRFCSEMKPPVYCDDEIKSVRIGIFDGDKVIESGPFSKLKVEVLALQGSFPYDAHGSWTSEEFHQHRAYGRDGKGNVLAGKGTNAQLINGECHLGSIRFTEGSCRAHNRMFIVGARVCNSQAICGRVQEAVMNPVVVLDRRNKYNEKSHPPKLDDEVHRLEKISLHGKYRERLEKESIRTVEHFLKALYKDEDDLAKILQIKKKCKDWNKMVDHAQECCLEGKPELKLYWCAERNVVLFFNYVHRLVGARFGRHYITSNKFDPAQKNLVDKLKKNAYEQLDGLTGDHVMMDNIPVPIGMNTDDGAGPSCMTGATQRNNYGHHIAAHHVGGTPASEVLRLCAPTEPLRETENTKNAHGLNSSISEPNSTQKYQVEGIPAVEGLSHGLNESPFFYVPDHLTTQNYQGVPGSHQEEMQFPVDWPDNDTLEAVSLALYTVPTPQLLDNTDVGAPGSGQGSMLNQTQASLPNDGTMGSPGSAQQDRPPHQWSQCQRNMPGNTSF